MKKINKTDEPDSLVQHKANRPSLFSNLPLATKEALRQSLLFEQGHICCYCMKRIPEKVETNSGDTGMKIEHFKCQERFPQLQLTYSNLFGACKGGEGMPKKLQTCDTKKANADLIINPLLDAPNCEALFKYTAEGEILSLNDDEEINRQLNVVLNLNMQNLKDARREVYLEVQRRVENESKRIASRQIRVGFFEQEKNNWLTKTDNRFRPYCMVAVYYLNKKIKQNQV